MKVKKKFCVYISLNLLKQLELLYKSIKRCVFVKTSSHYRAFRLATFGYVIGILCGSYNFSLHEHCKSRRKIYVVETNAKEGGKSSGPITHISSVEQRRAMPTEFNYLPRRKKWKNYIIRLSFSDDLNCVENHYFRFHSENNSHPSTFHPTPSHSHAQKWISFSEQFTCIIRDY